MTFYFGWCQYNLNIPQKGRFFCNNLVHNWIWNWLEICTLHFVSEWFLLNIFMIWSLKVPEFLSTQNCLLQLYLPVVLQSITNFQKSYLTWCYDVTYKKGLKMTFLEMLLLVSAEYRWKSYENTLDKWFY